CKCHDIRIHLRHPLPPPSDRGQNRPPQRPPDAARRHPSHASPTRREAIQFWLREATGDSLSEPPASPSESRPRSGGGTIASSVGLRQPPASKSGASASREARILARWTVWGPADI